MYVKRNKPAAGEQFTCRFIPGGPALRTTPEERKKPGVTSHDSGHFNTVIFPVNIVIFSFYDYIDLYSSFAFPSSRVLNARIFAAFRLVKITPMMTMPNAMPSPKLPMPS